MLRIKFIGGRQFSPPLPAGRQGNRQLFIAAKRYSAGVITLKGPILKAIGLLMTLIYDNTAIGKALDIGLMFSSFIILVVAREK